MIVGLTDHRPPRIRGSGAGSAVRWCTGPITSTGEDRPRRDSNPKERVYEQVLQSPFAARLRRQHWRRAGRAATPLMRTRRPAASASESGMAAAPSNPFAQSEMDMDRKVMADRRGECRRQLDRQDDRAPSGCYRHVPDRTGPETRRHRWRSSLNKRSTNSAKGRSRSFASCREDGLAGPGQREPLSVRRRCRMRQGHDGRLKGAADVSVSYVRKMVEHHKGAVAMSDVALGNGVAGELRAKIQKTRSDQQKDAAMIEGHAARRAHDPSSANVGYRTCRSSPRLSLRQPRRQRLLPRLSRRAGRSRQRLHPTRNRQRTLRQSQRLRLQHVPLSIMPWDIADGQRHAVGLGKPQLYQEFLPAISSERPVQKDAQMAGIDRRRPGGHLDADRSVHDRDPHRRDSRRSLHPGSAAGAGEGQRTGQPGESGKRHQ